MVRHLSRRRYLFWNRILPFDGTGSALPNVRSGSPGNRLGASRLKPRLHFTEIPDHASWSQREPSWKLSALFHLIDCAVRQRHELTKLVSPNCSSNRLALCSRHFAFLSRWKQKGSNSDGLIKCSRTRMRCSAVVAYKLYVSIPHRRLRNALIFTRSGSGFDPLSAHHLTIRNHLRIWTAKESHGELRC